MGRFRFSMMMLKKEYKKSFAYGLTMIFAFMTMFIFFNIINNEFIKDPTLVRSGTTMQDVSVPISTLVSFLTVLFCGFMLGYANNFYLSHKTDEIAVMGVSGSTFLGTTLYIFYQVFLIALIALPIGLIGGLLGSYVIQYVMYDYLNITQSIFTISIRSYTDSIIFYLVILLITIILDSGYVYQHDLQYLLMQEDSNDLSVNKKYSVNDYVYIIITILFLLFVIITPYSPSAYLFPCFVGVFGMSRIICQVIPHFIDHNKMKLFGDNKILLISSSNLSFSLKRTSTLIMLYSISSISMIALLISQKNFPREFITSIIAYGVITILLLVSLMYKYSSEAQNRVIMYFNLFKLGYVKKQLYRIIRYEVISFYGLLVGLPFIYFLVLMILFYINHAVEVPFLVMLTLLEIVPVIIVAVLTYRNYCHSVMEKIERNIK